MRAFGSATPNLAPAGRPRAQRSRRSSGRRRRRRHVGGSRRPHRASPRSSRTGASAAPTPTPPMTAPRAWSPPASGDRRAGSPSERGTSLRQITYDDAVIDVSVGGSAWWCSDARGRRCRSVTPLAIAFLASHRPGPAVPAERARHRLRVPRRRRWPSRSRRRRCGPWNGSPRCPPRRSLIALAVAWGTRHRRRIRVRPSVPGGAACRCGPQRRRGRHRGQRRPHRGVAAVVAAGGPLPGGDADRDDQVDRIRHHRRRAGGRCGRRARARLARSRCSGQGLATGEACAEPAARPGLGDRVTVIAHARGHRWLAILRPRRRLGRRPRPASPPARPGGVAARPRRPPAGGVGPRRGDAVNEIDAPFVIGPFVDFGAAPEQLAEYTERSVRDRAAWPGRLDAGSFTAGVEVTSPKPSTNGWPTPRRTWSAPRSRCRPTRPRRRLGGGGDRRR